MWRHTGPTHPRARYTDRGPKSETNSLHHILKGGTRRTHFRPAGLSSDTRPTVRPTGARRSLPVSEDLPGRPNPSEPLVDGTLTPRQSTWVTVPLAAPTSVDSRGRSGHPYTLAPRFRSVQRPVTSRQKIEGSSPPRTRRRVVRNVSVRDTRTECTPLDPRGPRTCEGRSRRPLAVGSTTDCPLTQTTTETVDLVEPVDEE